MSVLVAYASRHGATRGIAERIAERLRTSGLDVEVRQAREVRALAAYDAFVIGSAVYFFRWLGDASRLVRRNRALLATRPVWLFSSGPVGPDVPDAQGLDPRATAGPREMAAFRAEIRPRGDRVFFGAFDSLARRQGISERLVMALPAARKAFPEGDFRNWDDIDAWAAGIARELAPEVASRL